MNALAFLLVALSLGVATRADTGPALSASNCPHLSTSARSQALDRRAEAGDTPLRVYYHSEGVKTGCWPRRRHAYSPEFQTYLAQTPAPPQEIGSLNDLFENLRASS